ncbi:threonine aldolase family protein [Polymorphum gilvum]|uniref:L-threonine aldolase n=1 Tax=Polymorphum gilvum (strain LMG 25793 / CGMCC 1.9160 / SL003B-26A1) TaxID=991905 RepID=F2IWI4_POLGS|nr:low specificity L-threonine aldolase [Polymorphum gilvum]ADZ69283.1 Beta-eliminating lyase superfamily [Polymorphum gilvum SL003B-26A1]
MTFASDNWAGASAAVMAALARHNAGFEPAYGTDPLTQAVTARLAELFERDVAVFFVATGTAANALALSAVARPGGVVFCHAESHIQVDECGCPEFLTGGMKLRGIDGEGGKIGPAALERAMAAHPDGVVHHGQVAAVSITQATESGTVYAVDEIRALKRVAAGRGVPLHMDGARFANALVGLDVSPAEMTWKAGVDVLSFGATKNGCWCAEAVVFFDPAAAKEFGYLRKRAGHLLSKSRFVAAQFDGYLADGHWLDNARHANAMAARLGAGLVASGAARLAWPVAANAVFAILPRDRLARLEAAGQRCHEWSAEGLPEGERPAADEALVRLVASFATTVDEVDRFLALAAGAD